MMLAKRQATSWYVSRTWVKPSDGFGWVEALGTIELTLLGWNHGPLVWALKPGILIFLIYTRFVPFKVPEKG